MYYDTGNDTLFWHDGSVWVSARGGVSAVPPATTGALGTIQLAGDLAGTATSPQIAAGVITDAEVATANKDGAVGTASMRTLGAGAQQAMPGNRTLNQISVPTGNVAFGGYMLQGIGSPPVDPLDAASKQYVDGKIATVTPADATTTTKGIIQLAGDLTGTAASPQIANNVITDNEIATNNKDGVANTPSMRTLGSGGAQAMAGNTRLDQIPAPTASVNLNSRLITNLADPVAWSDAANKNYVDMTAQGLDAKQSVWAASLANVPLTNYPSGLSVDGAYFNQVSVGDRSRVLLKNQTNPVENGIYLVSGAAGGDQTLARALDMNDFEEFPGAFVFVESGDTQADTGWVCTADSLGASSPIVANTWVQFSGAGAVLGGAGLTKSGNQLDVGAGAGITVNADSIQVANNGITNAMIADGAVNLATADVTGILPTANGGTGSNSAVVARGNLGAAGFYTAVGPPAGGTTWDISPGTAYTYNCNVQISDVASKQVELPDITLSTPTANQIRIGFGASVTANSKRVTIVGYIDPTP